ncbi:hypothetical protein D9M73_185080 [compost metagenome]
MAAAYAHGGGFQLVQQQADFLHVLAALVGQQQALAHLLHQRAAEHVFQILDLPADGALGEVQLFGGAGHAHVSGESGEAAEGDHAGKLAAHRSSLHFGMIVSKIYRYSHLGKRSNLRPEGPLKG